MTPPPPVARALALQESPPSAAPLSVASSPALAAAADDEPAGAPAAFGSPGWVYPPVTGDGWGILLHDKMLSAHRDHLGYR